MESIDIKGLLEKLDIPTPEFVKKYRKNYSEAQSIDPENVFNSEPNANESVSDRELLLNIYDTLNKILMLLENKKNDK